MLRQAYGNVEGDLAAAGVEWTSPPFYHQLQSGPELLADIKRRKAKPKVVLADMETSRREAVERVEYAMRRHNQPATLQSHPVYLGDGRLRIGSDTITLEDTEDTVVRALVELQSASKGNLEQHSGEVALVV